MRSAAPADRGGDALAAQSPKYGVGRAPTEEKFVNGTSP